MQINVPSPHTLYIAVTSLILLISTIILITILLMIMLDPEYVIQRANIILPQFLLSVTIFLTAYFNLWDNYSILSAMIVFYALIYINDRH